MTFTDLVKKYGNANRAAKAVGVHRNTLYAWRDRGGIPFSAQFRIQLKTRGALKADVSALMK